MLTLNIIPQCAYVQAHTLAWGERKKRCGKRKAERERERTIRSPATFF
jgi:hypothetical protein